MGIYDRDYYRREGPSYLGSFTDRGKVCKSLILINIAVFVIQLMTRHQPSYEMSEAGPIVDPGLGQFTEFFLLDAPKILHGQIWRLITHAFLHSATTPFFSHIIFNMLFLWWFGSDVEDLYGPREFLTFYLTAAVIGGLAFVVANQAGLTAATQALGASGAVTAVLVLCAIHYPTRIIYFSFLIPIPIWLFVLFEVAQDTFILVGQFNTGVGVSAHLGGAAFAFAYYKFHWHLSDFWLKFKNLQRPRSRPRLRVYREEEVREPVAVTVPPSAEVDEQLEAKLDAILEKVARSGQDSLTDSERQLLLRASEVYKKKRT
jgi:membrane associated rhomboid family serine protease